MRRLVPTLVLLAAAGLVPLTSTEPARAVGATSPDFNGDGYADLAIGAQGENDGAGLVHVLYGSASGPSGAGSIAFSQATPGVAGDPLPNEYFGAIMAWGDVNADGYDDLAVSAIWDRVGNADDAGTVSLFRGSAAGLQMNPRVFTDNFGLTTKDRAQVDDGFGIGLAMGDYNGDGRDDIAIGVPFDNVPDAHGSGKVKLLMADSNGQFTEANVKQLARTTVDAQVRSDYFLDSFGAALVTLDGSSPFDGLAVGVVAATRRDNFDVLGGVVTYRGSGTNPRFAQWLRGPFGNDGYAGSSLAAGDLNNDGQDDLVIGAPTAHGERGAIEVALLKSDRSSLRNPWIFDQDSTGFAASNRVGDWFGYALAVADAGATAYIYIGTPHDDVLNKTNSGSVFVLAATNNTRPLAARSTPINSGNSSIQNGSFGIQVTALDATNDGIPDVVIGADGEAVGSRSRAGAAYWYDSVDGAPITIGVRYTQETPGVPGNAERDDNFGSTLAWH